MSDDPRPLRPKEARRSLAQRLGRVADRARRIPTRLGVRPYRVLLRWTKWGVGQDAERGDGYEADVATVEVLPTPLVTSMDSVSYSIFHAGVVPAGSVRVGEISVVSFTEDNLRGLEIPDVEWLEGPAERLCPLPTTAELRGTGEGSVAEPYSFFWEVVEDGRHDDPAQRKRFRLLSTPMLYAENCEWRVMLERTSADRERGNKGGASPFAPGQGR